MRNFEILQQNGQHNQERLSPCSNFLSEFNACDLSVEKIEQLKFSADRAKNIPNSVDRRSYLGLPVVIGEDKKETIYFCSFSDTRKADMPLAQQSCRGCPCTVVEGAGEEAEIPVTTKFAVKSQHPSLSSQRKWELSQLFQRKVSPIMCNKEEGDAVIDFWLKRNDVEKKLAPGVVQKGNGKLNSHKNGKK